ncbi:MAG: 4'-phosphopantetheinyl transferase superfamily protein [Clostridia bacterium]|nr:4'-phosphopantetheinyl transferase superfamily protein [Clostridia bacterium]
MLEEDRLYIASLFALDALRAKWGTAISEYRRQKLETVADSGAKNLGLLVEYLTLEALSAAKPGFFPPCRIETGAHGKPELSDCPGLHFSLSHDGDYAAVLLSTAPVGLDLVRKRPVRTGLADRIATAREREELRSATDGDDAVLKLWARKESVQKWSGLGFTLPMRSIETSGKAFYEESFANCFLCAYSDRPLRIRRWFIGGME